MNFIPCIFHGVKYDLNKNNNESLKKHSITKDTTWRKINIGQQVSNGSNVKCFQIDDIYVKVYDNSKTIIRYFLRPSKCQNEALSYKTLQTLKLPIPDLISFGEKRFLGFLVENIIITQAIPNSIDLGAYTRQTYANLATNDKAEVFKKISTQLLKYLKIAHHNNFYFYDLNLRNILYCEDLDQLYFIDSPRGRVKRINKNRGVLIDLHCLAKLGIFYFSKTQRYKFLCDYLDLPGGKKVKALYRKINQRLEKHPPRKPKN